MFSYSVFALVLCGLLQSTIAAPLESRLDVLDDLLAGKSLKQWATQSGVKTTDSIVIADTLKAAIQSVKAVKNGADLQETVAKSVEDLIQNFSDVFGDEASIDRSGVEATLKKAIEKLESVSDADLEGLLNKIAQFENEVLNSVSQDAKDILNTIAENAQQLIEDTKNAIESSNDANNKEILESVSHDAEEVVSDAKNAIEEISNSNEANFKGIIDVVSEKAQNLVNKAKGAVISNAFDKGSNKVIQGGSNLLHTAVNKLDGGAQKVVETSDKINKGVHKLIGNAIDAVSGGAHKVVDTITGILTWGKNKAKKASSSA